MHSWLAASSSVNPETLELGRKFAEISAKDFGKFLDFSANFCNLREKKENSVIVCHFPQFRQNSVKFAAKNDKFAEKSAKFCKNTENLKKIAQNNAKISKILKIQLVNLVDLEKCEKMSLLSHSEASIQPIFGP